MLAVLLRGPLLAGACMLLLAFWAGSPARGETETPRLRTAFDRLQMDGTLNRIRRRAWE